MKNFKDIEKILKESKLPDRDMSHHSREVWHRIIKARKEHRKRNFLSYLKPWVWALASIILILICILFMILMKKS